MDIILIIVGLIGAAIGALAVDYGRPTSKNHAERPYEGADLMMRTTNRQ